MMIEVMLADPAARLPMPGQPAGVYAPAGRFTVDDASPFWAQCLADGSVTRAPDAPTPAKPSTKPATS